ncbi:MAG: hypothetical protein RLZ95_979 [Bacteroidota bacterium]|jgi:predicted RNase H-like nuclease (RuvC/YqgF family)
MKSIQDKIEQLEKELAELKQEVVSRNNQHTTINSVEDAFNLLKPEWYIDDYLDIYQMKGEMTNYKVHQCNMTSEKRAKQIKALIQLHLIAEAMNMGVEMEEIVYIVAHNIDIWSVENDSFHSSVIPIFHTQKLAEEALENFKPLFMDLYLLND